jgi:hypothetical protein
MFLQPLLKLVEIILLELINMSVNSIALAIRDKVFLLGILFDVFYLHFGLLPFLI